MRRTGLYARISEDHEGLRLGVERQISDGQQLITRKGWSLVDTYVDNDVSATRGKPRPEYVRLLSDMANGELDAVVVWSLDRLHRRPAELEEFISLAERHGVALASVSGEHDLATPDGRLFARMLGVVAAGEAEKISHRVSRKQQQLREQGRPFGGGIRPYGYAADRMTVIPEEAAVIRSAVARVLAGESIGSLVADLNDRNVPTVSAWLAAQQAERGLKRQTKPSQWSRTSLRTLLSRPRIAGLMTYKGDVVGKGAWPAIIDRETFERLQVVLKDRSQTGRAVSNARQYLLSGIATCGVCGRGLQVGHPGGRSGHRGLTYRCPSQKHVQRHMGKVDDEVVRRVWEYREEVARHAGQLLQSLRAHQEADPTSADIERLRARLDEAAEQYADEAITGEQLTTITRRLRDRIDHLERSRPSPVVVPVASLPAMPWGAFREQFDAMTLSQQRFTIQSETVAVRVLASKRRGGNVFDPSLIDVQFPQLPSTSGIASA